MGFRISNSRSFLYHQLLQPKRPRALTLRYLSLSKDTESHLLPRLYVGPISETAVSLSQFLSNPQHSNSKSLLLKEGTIQQLSSDQSHYVTNVMRMVGPGRKKGRWTFQESEPCCRLFDGGEEWVAQLEVEGDIPTRRNRRKDVTVLARCLAPLPSSTAQLPRITPVLCFAPPKKKDRYQWILEKSTELGMEAWLLLQTERTESSSSRDYEKKGQAYVLEASEQCERQTVPPLLSLADTEESSALSDLSSLLGMAEQLSSTQHTVIFVCRERSSSSLPILDAIQQTIKAQDGPCTCLVLVGPEGGWSPQEEAAFDKLCQEKPGIVQNVSLGSNVLRTDTAAVTAMAAFAFQNDL